MRRRNVAGISVEMNLYEETKNRPSESTTSSDSGVIIEESTDNLKNEVSTKIEIDNRLGHTNESAERSSIKESISHKNVKIEDDPEDRQTTSSTQSERSHNISIVSLEDGDSSAIDSDSDFSDAPGEFVIQKLGQHSSEVSKDGIVIIKEHMDREASSSSGGVIASKPQIGSIAVQNSTDITFGNKTFYQGPVTIKQFLLDNKKWKPREGADNDGFECDESGGAAGGVGDVDSAGEQTQWNNLRTKLNLHSRSSIIAVIIILISIVIFIATSITLATLYSMSSDSSGTDEGVLRLISRDEWSAQPPTENLTTLQTPVEMVIIAHTVTEGCKTFAMCVYRVHSIQDLHIKQFDFGDIGYNFLVGGDGAAYEGRGWDFVGAHTQGFNSKSIGVSFIGTFITNAPQEKQLKAAKLLLKEGVRQGKIAPDYRLYGARQLQPTESPGSALYEIIKTWPHWSDEI